MEKLQNIPAFKAAAALAVGILIGTGFDLGHLYPFIALVILLASSAFYIKSYSNGILSLVLIYSMIIIFGIFRAGLDFYSLPHNSTAYIPDTPSGTDYKIIGVINDIPDYDSTRIRFNIDSEGLITGADTIPIKGEVITTIFKSRYKDEGSPPILKAGDRAALTGRLLTPWGERNPGEFDYQKYLMTQDIYKSFLVYGYKNSENVSSKNLGFLQQSVVFPAKYFATETIERNMRGDEAEYLKGLVTGQRNDISAETKDAFIKTGVMHLIAVSGLNVAYVIIIIVTVLSIFRIYFRWKTALVISALIFYCLFTGSSPSIVRATIMGILILLAYDSERKANFYNVVGFSAFVILIFNTKQLFDPGFILSYTAVLSMVLCYEKLKPYLVEGFDGRRRWYRRWAKYTLILFVTTLAAQIGVLPVAGSYFEKISIISLPANLIIVPMANISLAIGFMQIIAAAFSGYLSSVIAGANSMFLSWQLGLIKWFSSFDFAYFEVFCFDTITIAAYFVCLLLLLTMTGKNLRFRIVMVVLIFLGIALHNIETESKLRVSFLDVSAGECTVIRTPDGKTILIDCGMKSETYDSGERTIIPYLKRQGIEQIDLLILTGTDENKTGGMESITDNFPVSKVLAGGVAFSKLHKSLSLEKVSDGDYVDGVEDMRIYFLSEGTVKIIYRDLAMLFSSDNDGSYLISKYGELLESDIVRLNNDSKILEHSHPGICISSVSPTSKSYRSMSMISDSLNFRLYTTNRQGAFIIESSGDNIAVIDWR